MRLIVIRHGETEWNLHKMTQGMSNTPLTETGIWQAGRLASRLQRMRVQAVYTSPLQRAVETAQIIAKGGGFPCHIDDALREIRFGHWEGLTFTQIAQRFPEALRIWNASPERCVLPGNAESVSDVLARCRDFVARMRAIHEEDCIVAVTHSIPSKLLIADGIALPLEQMHSLHIDNASMNMLEYYSERCVLRLLNDISHLNQARATR